MCNVQISANIAGG